MSKRVDKKDLEFVSESRSKESKNKKGDRSSDPLYQTEHTSDTGKK